MFNSANQTHFRLAIDDFANDLQVLAFKGQEGISQPYRFDLQLVSENPNLDVQALLHKQAFLSFDPQGHGVHGQIHRVAQGDRGKRLSHYQLSLVPRLDYLRHRINQRIFQQRSAPRIIAAILEEHGILADAYQFQIEHPCPDRDYCVQYDESDLHFIQRLCEEEGLHYHFRHNPRGHLLVFGDNQSVFPRLGRPTAYVHGGGLLADEPVIKGFEVRLESRTTRAHRRDYDFEKPRLQLESSYKSERQRAGPDLEDYDYPGRFTDRARGQLLSQRTLERHRADYQQAEGWGDQTRLVSGHFLELSEHPCKPWNDLWLLTHVTHEGKQPQVLEEFISSDTQEDFQQGYRNRFFATPWDVFYRPPLKHSKPQVLGSQTAVVTGPKGEEIHTDRFGRVKVQFFWDREGQGDDGSSCWLRVASSWAGDRYGGIIIPRVGMEVLVTFLEGDPDQPLVSGCLYHQEHVAPYDLPAHKTLSGFKTLSSAVGGGFNELHIEDQPGAEQVFIHAQRDWDEHIEHDQKIHIGRERHDRVDANSYRELKAEEHRSSHGERKTAIKADDHLSVAGTRHIKLGIAQLTQAGNEIHLKAGSKAVFEAAMEMTLKVGASFIKLDPSGVTLLGALVKYNAGGVPGAGTGVGIQPPIQPGAVGRETAGRLMETALVNTPHAFITPSAKRRINFSG